MAKSCYFRPALLLLLLLLVRAESRGQFEPKILLPTEKTKPTADQDEDGIGTRWAVLVAGSSGYGNYRHQLWRMRSSLDLLGTTLDVVTGEWIEYSSSIGAGVDSFYEYLLKAYILFGKEDYWRMFRSAYMASQKYFRHGPW